MTSYSIWQSKFGHACLQHTTWRFLKIRYTNCRKIMSSSWKLRHYSTFYNNLLLISLYHDVEYLCVCIYYLLYFYLFCKGLKLLVLSTNCHTTVWTQNLTLVKKTEDKYLISQDSEVAIELFPLPIFYTLFCFSYYFCIGSIISHKQCPWFSQHFL